MKHRQKKERIHDMRCLKQGQKELLSLLQKAKEIYDLATAKESDTEKSHQIWRMYCAIMG